MYLPYTSTENVVQEDIYCCTTFIILFALRPNNQHMFLSRSCNYPKKIYCKSLVIFLSNTLVFVRLRRKGLCEYYCPQGQSALTN